MKRSLLALCAMALLALAASPLSAAVTVYAVHGIPGVEVDVYLTQADAAPTAPTIPGFKFKDIAGPLSIPAGTYDVWVFAQGANPGMAAPVLTLTGAALADNSNVSIVAHLTGTGEPALTPFFNDVRQDNRLVPEQFLTRVGVAHAAQAPQVFFKIDRLLEASLVNGQQTRLAGLNPARYTLSLVPASDPAGPAVFGPATLTLNGRTLYNAYAVGSVEDGTFTVLLQEILLAVQ
jgi:hypothetical protein